MIVLDDPSPRFESTKGASDSIQRSPTMSERDPSPIVLNHYEPPPQYELPSERSPLYDNVYPRRYLTDTTLANPRARARFIRTLVVALTLVSILLLVIYVLLFCSFVSPRVQYIPP